MSESAFVAFALSLRPSLHSTSLDIHFSHSFCCLACPEHGRGADVLGRLKVEVFKPFRKKAQDKYRAYIDGYVKSILGRPMETLTVGAQLECSDHLGPDCSCSSALGPILFA